MSINFDAKVKQTGSNAAIARADLDDAYGVEQQVKKEKVSSSFEFTKKSVVSGGKLPGISIQAPNTNFSKDIAETEPERLLRLGQDLANIDARINVAQSERDAALATLQAAQSRLDQVNNYQKQEDRKRERPAAEAAVRQAQAAFEPKDSTLKALQNERKLMIERAIEDLRGPQIRSLQAQRAPINDIRGKVVSTKDLLANDQASLRTASSNVASVDPYTTVLTSSAGKDTIRTAIDRMTLVAAQDKNKVDWLNTNVDSYNIATADTLKKFALALPSLDTWSEVLTAAKVTEAQLDVPESSAIAALRAQATQLDAEAKSLRDQAAAKKAEAEQPGTTPEQANELLKQVIALNEQATAKATEATKCWDAIKEDEQARLAIKKDAMGKLKTQAEAALDGVITAIEPTEADLNNVQSTLLSRCKAIDDEITAIRAKVVTDAQAAYEANHK